VEQNKQGSLSTLQFAKRQSVRDLSLRKWVWSNAAKDA
jgi:hypothetical protein